MSLEVLQPQVSRLLKKVWRNGKLSHAYLFSGEAGVGKKQMSLWMAKRYFCSKPVNEEPCGYCSECKRIDSFNHPDLHYIEPDGQSIKIDQIRSLQKEFHFKGVESDRKCYIIEHVDKMTTQAANSLLKFLEEPNGNSLAILLSENKNKLLDAILSRAQLYNFQPMSEDYIYSLYVKEGQLPENAFLLSKITTNVTKGKELIENEWFLKAKEIILLTLHQLIEEPYLAVVTLQTEWTNHFSDKDKQQISLKLLTIWFQEVISLSLNRKVHLTDQQPLLESYKNRYDISDLTTILEELVQASGMLRSNTHYLLVLERISHACIEIVR